MDSSPLRAGHLRFEPNLPKGGILPCKSAYDVVIMGGIVNVLDAMVPKICSWAGCLICRAGICIHRWVI